MEEAQNSDAALRKARGADDRLGSIASLHPRRLAAIL
jgi:hypothetical protein